MARHDYDLDLGASLDLEEEQELRMKEEFAETDESLKNRVVEEKKQREDKKTKEKRVIDDSTKKEKKQEEVVITPPIPEIPKKKNYVRTAFTLIILVIVVFGVYLYNGSLQANTINVPEGTINDNIVTEETPSADDIINDQLSEKLAAARNNPATTTFNQE